MFLGRHCKGLLETAHHHQPTIQDYKSHLKELEVTAGEPVLLERLVQAVCEALQVAQHAAKAAK